MRKEHEQQLAGGKARVWQVGERAIIHHPTIGTVALLPEEQDALLLWLQAAVTRRNTAEQAWIESGEKNRPHAS